VGSENEITCGTVVKKSLSVRTHICGCGTILDRDENVAINILMKAFEVLGKNTVGHTEIHAQGQFGLCSVDASLHRKPSGKTRKGRN